MFQNYVNVYQRVPCPSWCWKTKFQREREGKIFLAPRSANGRIAYNSLDPRTSMALLQPFFTRDFQWRNHNFPWKTPVVPSKNNRFGAMCRKIHPVECLKWHLAAPLPRQRPHLFQQPRTTCWRVGRHFDGGQMMISYLVARGVEAAGDWFVFRLCYIRDNCTKHPRVFTRRFRLGLSRKAENLVVRRERAKERTRN